MAKRFEFIQKFDEFTDYATSLDAVENGTEPYRRLTLVERATESYAYLTTKDNSTARITVQRAQELLAEEV